MRRTAGAHARFILAGSIATACWLSTGSGLASPPPGTDLRALASRARDVQIERHHWDEQEGTMRTAASGRMTTAWLESLIGVGLRESGLRPDSPCAAACQRCPEQLTIHVSFKVESQDYSLSLFMREGLAILHRDWAAAWGFADSIGPVLDLVREALSTDTPTQAWVAPAVLPAPLDADSAAYRWDAVLVTGMPEALKKVPPSYPNRARNRGISGVVQVQALVAVDGRVDRVRVAKSVPGLDEAALEAVRKWKFRPATCGGQVIPVWVMIPVKFSLH